MTVSIIIPVYNVSSYIERCIESVMNQTYKDIECIIVDDDTSDDSIVKCEKMIASYDGPVIFSILNNAQNKGLSAARNLGTKAATGEYLYYLDSDDEITPDCIETLLKPMIENSSIEMIQGNHIVEKGGQEMMYFKGTSSIVVSCHHDIYEHYFKYHHICASAWNKLIRRSFIDNYHLYFKEGILFEDRLWMFYVQKNINKLIISKDITYIYHIRPHSITTGGNSLAIGNSFLVLYHDILTNLTPNSEAQEISGYAYGFCKQYCIYVNDIPELKDIHNLYLQQARHYNCWYAYILLSIVGFVRKIGNPIGIMKKFHIIRWRLMELPDIIFNRK